jgi:RNA polymerase sigma-70 factor (ECF subfamily)
MAKIAGVRFDTVDDVAALFVAVSPKLLRIALRRCGNSDDAEDIMQQTFLTALEKRSRFESGRSVEAWLVGILVKHHLHARRRESRRVDPHRVDGSFAAPAGEVASLRERETLLARAIGELPEPYRRVVELFFLEGLDQTEIAERVDRPKSTVSTQINRGIERLRERLPDSVAWSA